MQETPDYLKPIDATSYQGVRIEAPTAAQYVAAQDLGSTVVAEAFVTPEVNPRTTSA